MRQTTVFATLAAAATLCAGLAVAQDMLAPEEAHAFREEHMKVYGRNLGVLGGMAQGEAAYDAAAAQAAADAILANATSPDWAIMWPEGSATGEVEGSRALPAIWENPEDFEAQHQELVTAAMAMQAAAGTDLAALQAAMGGVGASCGGCHESYRAPEE